MIILRKLAVTFSILRLSRRVLQLDTKWDAGKFARINSNVWSSSPLNTRLINSAPEPSAEEYDSLVEKLSNGDAELEKRLKMLMLEVEVLRQEGRQVPDHIKEIHWQELLKKPTRSAQRKYLIFLFKTEKTKQNIKAKKEERRIIRETEPRQQIKEFEDDLDYSIVGNSFFLRIRDKSMDTFYNNRALLAMQEAQPIVIDCSYDEHMRSREIHSTVKQLLQLYSDNRRHPEPFAIHLCSAAKTSQTIELLQKGLPRLLEPDIPLIVSPESHIDKFPKNKLVYLTPHCQTEMLKYDHDAVYIIGAMVDKGLNKGDPVSLAKAKRDGIKYMRLPLDRYLRWGSGAHTSLALNHILCILLDMKMTNDWMYALRHVPRRKLFHVIDKNKKYP